MGLPSCFAQTKIIQLAEQQRLTLWWLTDSRVAVMHQYNKIIPQVSGRFVISKAVMEPGSMANVSQKCGSGLKCRFGLVRLSLSSEFLPDVQPKSKLMSLKKSYAVSPLVKLRDITFSVHVMDWLTKADARCCSIRPAFIF